MQLKFITSKNIENENFPGFIREVNDLGVMLETIKVGSHQGFYIKYDTTNQDGVRATIVRCFDAMPSQDTIKELRCEAERQFNIFFGVKNVS